MAHLNLVTSLQKGGPRADYPVPQWIRLVEKNHHTETDTIERDDGAAAPAHKQNRGMIGRHIGSAPLCAAANAR